jgi:hypothetical protein
MKNAKAIGLVLIGVVIGALGVGAGLKLQAQASAPRITSTPAGPMVGPDRRTTTGIGNLSFIKDAKSGGCWLYATQSGVSGDSALALAVAPPSACD